MAQRAGKEGQERVTGGRADHRVSSAGLTQERWEGKAGLTLHGVGGGRGGAVCVCGVMGG